jgi:hypothetical protein
VLLELRLPVRLLALPGAGQDCYQERYPPHLARACYPVVRSGLLFGTVSVCR